MTAEPFVIETVKFAEEARLPFVRAPVSRLASGVMSPTFVLWSVPPLKVIVYWPGEPVTPTPLAPIDVRALSAVCTAPVEALYASGVVPWPPNSEDERAAVRVRDVDLLHLVIGGERAPFTATEPRASG